MVGKTVKIFLVNGTLDGIITAEIPEQWIGKVLSAPLSRFDELKERDEISRSGVYVLIGDNGK